MISNKCYYALCAVLELARRAGTRSDPVSIAEIAQAQQLPSRFLEGILRELKHGGITESIRGKDGGYLLARPPRKITVGDIIRLFENPFISVPASAPRPGEQDSVFDEIWHEAEAALEGVFDGVNFEELVERERQRQWSYVSNYAI